MAHILKGAPVAQAMTECFRQEAEILKEQGVQPTLAIVRVGERADDLSYERGAMKRAASMGIDVKQIILPEDVDSDTFFGELRRVNEDADVHGILLFRPLPRHLDGERARQMIDPAKDVDGCTDGSPGSDGDPPFLRSGCQGEARGGHRTVSCDRTPGRYDAHA